MSKIINLRVDSYEELRDSLPMSGLFEMFDCDVELECPVETPDSEIDRMFGIIRSTINVVKTRVISTGDDSAAKYADEFYLYNFRISEVQYRNHQGRFQR